MSHLPAGHIFGGKTLCLSGLRHPHPSPAPEPTHTPCSLESSCGVPPSPDTSTFYCPGIQREKQPDAGSWACMEFPSCCLLSSGCAGNRSCLQPSSSLFPSTVSYICQLESRALLDPVAPSGGQQRYSTNSVGENGKFCSEH
ncbi:hypothetical protein KIL84_001203 [Mauremys mutica]|uniref:Uncharacterized protein n=1 Tax=Mauremys mutica TaxID=74926 RepID=A0A9D4ATH5_9SAUR|nr:hypothetical protein KIL84_001203 [Mauremys mutica]